MSNIFRHGAKFILLMLILGKSVIGHTQSKSNNCKNETLQTYVDSLANLILANQPLNIIKISDSLLQKNDSPNCSDVIKIKASKANAYELLYNFETAVEIYNEILPLTIKNQLIEEEVDIRLSMARVYETIGRPELCLENLNKAKELIDAHQLMKQLSRYCIRFASYQRVHLRDKDLAKEYIIKGIELGKEHGVARSVADGYLVLGIVTDNFEESIQHFQQASNLFFELGDYIGGMLQQLNIASGYLRHGSYDKALAIVNEVEEYTNKITNNDKVLYKFKSLIAKIKADIYEKTGNKDSLVLSLKNYNKYSELFGFIANQEHINQLLLENAVSQEKEKVEAAKKQNRLLFIGLIFLSGIILLLSRLYMQNTSKKNKIQEQTLTITNQYNELEKLYNYKSTLLSEVHHRIKNNLQLIISLLTLQKAKLGNEFDKEILDILSYRINSISLIHEQLYNLKEFDNVEVNLYLKDLLKNFRSLIAEENVIIGQKADDIKLNLETVTPLGLIWSELISNSLKYNSNTDELKIYLDLIKKEDSYYMHYHDNGVGYPEGQFYANEKGMGFTIVDSLSRQLSGKSKTYNSNGAHFTLEFKEKIISPL